MTDPLHITVLRGGPSAEREVSLRSGAAVAKALRSLGHKVDEVDPIPGDLRIPAGTRAVFLALHGTYGEDGTVQSELEELGFEVEVQFQPNEDPTKPKGVIIGQRPLAGSKIEQGELISAIGASGGRSEGKCHGWQSDLRTKRKCSGR